MSTSARPLDIELKSWFEAFRRQSAEIAALGKMNMSQPRHLGGGKSGAMAALFIPSKGPVVLKWDSLEKIVQESEARRARPDQQDNMTRLRDRGASHIAIHQEPSSGDLFGIMAYPYLGPFGRGARRDLVGDFQWFLRKKYGEDWGDPTLREVFEKLLAHFEPFPLNDGRTAAGVSIQELPDLEGWSEKHASAADVARTVPGAEQTLVALANWASQLIDEDDKPDPFDSRLIHGDPRFANIMVDLKDHEVGLIDFGAGGPGGHIFRDLARFEVDLLLRTTEPNDREDEIRARGKALFRHDAPETHVQTARVAEVWCRVRNRTYPNFHNEPVRALHALFISMEMLRRIDWHRTLQGDADSGATVQELFLALDVLMESVPA